MNRVPSVLREIMDRKRQEVREGRKRRSEAELAEAVAGMPPCRPFAGRVAEIRHRGEVAVIAEIKRASPSAGVLRRAVDPAAIAAAYAAAGAACLSVLTDRHFFRGHPDDLRAARGATALPVLRKDFILDPWQVLESRVMGADAVLLIVACLDDDALEALHAQARQLGLDVLVEVHDEAELQRALALPSPLIGINNRDLHRFVTDLGTSERLAAQVPPECPVVSESGIHGPDDVRRLRRAGIGAFLVGEALMRAEDPGQALAALRAA